ncbi:hypothetical protein, conserved [Eimeria praecox]|uniref:Uncharacterized protein n=1 Tax=Eimeria praecox TaxID=51316 RepID=U6GWR9_9EIME|nr:hypothetical protein, conserved [Eimeria praecox]
MRGFTGILSTSPPLSVFLLFLLFYLLTAAAESARSTQSNEGDSSGDTAKSPPGTEGPRSSPVSSSVSSSYSSSVSSGLSSPSDLGLEVSPRQLPAAAEETDAERRQTQEGRQAEKQHPCISGSDQSIPCKDNESLPRVDFVLTEETASAVSFPLLQQQETLQQTNSSSFHSKTTPSFNLLLLQQLFDPSCPVHWGQLAAPAAAETQQQQQQQQQQQAQEGEKETPEASAFAAPLPFLDLRDTDSNSSSNSNNSSSSSSGWLQPYRLRLHASPPALIPGVSTAVYAEVVDAKGRIFPTDCGSVSLQLIEDTAAADRTAAAAAAEAFVSGLGPQMLQRGRATWLLHAATSVSSSRLFFVFEGITRLCTAALSEGYIQLDSLYGEGSLPAAQLLLPVVEQVSPSSAAGVSSSLVGERRQETALQREASPLSLDSVIVKVHLQEARLAGCSVGDTNEMRGETAETAVSLIDDKETPCEPLSLVFIPFKPAVTPEHPRFTYFVRLSRQPERPVSLSITPQLRRGDTEENKETPSTSLLLFIKGQQKPPGLIWLFTPQQWEQFVAVEIELSLTAAAAAAAAAADAAAGGRQPPFELHVAHSLSPFTPAPSPAAAAAVATAAAAADADAGGPSPLSPPTVSVHCRVYTYTDDARKKTETVGEGPFDSLPPHPSRPLAVRCRLELSKDVRGEIGVQVNAGDALRLVSPSGGKELLLRAQGDSLLLQQQREAASLQGAEDSEKGTEGDRGSTQETEDEVIALVRPKTTGCQDTACTLSFHLGLRDERAGGDLRLLPLGGRVAVFPSTERWSVSSYVADTATAAKEATPKETVPHSIELVRPWALMHANEVKIDLLITGDSPKIIEEILSLCLQAICERTDEYPVVASARCSIPTQQQTPLDNLSPQTEKAPVQLSLRLQPAVSAQCRLLSPQGQQVGVLQVAATTNTSCEGDTYYSRDTANCQPCPQGFFCSIGRLFRCAQPDKENCTLCPEGEESAKP